MHDGRVMEVLREQADEGALLRRGDRVLVAVSGGADSVALLTGLADLAASNGWALVVAHLNHGIRTDAAGDAAFVTRLAATLGLPCVQGVADVPASAARDGVSIEMAARAARYAFLLDAARERRCVAIATAHTADDQAETVLLRVARGTGLAGLAGIAPVRETEGLRLVRPLLAVTRAEIEGFLLERGLAWREDITNRDEAHLRNRVRHRVLPLLQTTLNPRIREALCRLAALASADQAALDALAREAALGCAAAGGRLAVGPWMRLPPALRGRVLLTWLLANGVPGTRVTQGHCDAVASICDTCDGSASLDMGEGAAVRREYGELRVVTGDTGRGVFCAHVTVPGVTVVHAAGLRIEASVAPGVTRDTDARVGVYPARASLAWEASQPPLVVRSRRDGDRMRPLGMTGSKKLQDILVDLRVPAAERGRVPVFACEEAIVWVPGYRVARGWEVTAAGPNLQLAVYPLGANNAD